MQCLSWETSENFERIKIRKFIIKKFVCSINRNKFDGISVKDQKSKHFYNRKIWSFAENWRRKKYEEKCLRGIWCKDEYDFHMDCKQKKIFEAHESVQTTSSQWRPRWSCFYLVQKCTREQYSSQQNYHQRESPEPSKNPY